ASPFIREVRCKVHRKVRQAKYAVKSGHVYAALVFIIYIVTICGNCLFIILIYYSKTLHSPMYFFLSQLSISDIMLNTANILNIVLYELTSKSFSDTSTVQMEITLLCVPVPILPFLVIVVSYIYIVLTILKISSFSGRLKSFSTCSSHLMLCLYFMEP
ncbi:hypothetical protein AB205_0111030, partial [Aquarana catesbeiana]